MSVLDGWSGPTRRVEDALDPFPARGMAALLDRDPESLGPGDPLPPGWHWLYFRTPVRTSALGPDGHEARGSFLPPVPLPRRMWAGGRLRFPGPPLVVGRPARMRSVVSRVVEKEGRSGPLVFVTVTHEFRCDEGLAVVEEQDLVYRGGTAPDAARRREEAPASADWTESITPDAVTLFRFSALTFNGHRIHYDHPYATGVEGYPGLVVHGPLLALLLLDAAGRWEGVSPAAFSYRATAPLFAGRPITLAGARSEAATELWAAGGDGAVAMRARADRMS